MVPKYYVAYQETGKRRELKKERLMVTFKINEILEWFVITNDYEYQFSRKKVMDDSMHAKSVKIHVFKCNALF